MKSDTEIREAVMEALSKSPNIAAENIGVSIVDGVVTLGGYVQDLLEKVDAEKCAWGVSGVRGLVSRIEVDLLSDKQHTDKEIAHAINHLFRWNAMVPKTVHAIVEDGKVILKGFVQWNFQRKAAEKAVRNVEGIIELKNRIKLDPSPSLEDVKKSITMALHRSAEADAKSLNIDIKDKKVILSGSVKTVAAKKEAIWAAWSIPGVEDVETHIVLY